MPNLTRREVLKATGAASLGLMIPGTDGRVHAQAGARARSSGPDSDSHVPHPRGDAGTGAALQAGITQSVARWCFEDIPL